MGKTAPGSASARIASWLFAGLLCWGGVARADGGVADPGVAALLARVSEAEVRRHVEILSGERDAPLRAGPRRITSRSVFHPDIQAAESYLAERLESLGYEVRRLPFPFPMQANFPLANLEATLPGEESPEQIYLLSAHYDSTAKVIASWDPTRDPAPGADDDGSGCALVLEAARVLRGARLRASVRFVLFSAEEIGLSGSQHYADEAKARGDDIRLVISMDPVGNGGPLKDNLFFTYDTPSRAEAELIQAVGTRYGLRYPIQIVPGDNGTVPDDRSDHYSFWRVGYLGLHGGSLPGDVYHTPDDRAALVDFPFLADATRAVTARLGEAAGWIGLRPGGGGCQAAPAHGAGTGLGWALLLLAAVLVVAARRAGRARPVARRRRPRSGA